jgi:hypothetical protein
MGYSYLGLVSQVYMGNTLWDTPDKKINITLETCETQKLKGIL